MLYLASCFTFLTDNMQKCYVCIGRCARSCDRVGDVVLIILSKFLGGNYVKPCMRELMKRCREGQCIRLSCLKLLYLDCMPRSKLDKIAAKTVCSGGCSNCTCEFCKCCSNCKIICKCLNK